MNIETAMIEHGVVLVFKTGKFYRELQRDIHGWWSVLEWSGPKKSGRGRLIYNTDSSRAEREEERAVKALLANDTTGIKGPRFKHSGHSSRKGNGH